MNGFLLAFLGDDTENRILKMSQTIKWELPGHVYWNGPFSPSIFALLSHLAGKTMILCSRVKCCRTLMCIFNDLIKPSWILHARWSWGTTSFGPTSLLFRCFSSWLHCMLVLPLSLAPSYEYVHGVITLEWMLRALSSLPVQLLPTCFRCFPVCFCGRWVWLSFPLWPIVGFLQHIWRV